MEDKDRFDALIKLAEFKSNIREKRREIEWKTSLGLWALTAGAILYMKGHSKFLLLILLFVIVIGHSWFWARTNFISAERDADMMYYFMDHAARLVIQDCVPDPGPIFPKASPGRKRWAFLKHEPLWFEIGATAILGFAAILLSPN